MDNKKTYTVLLFIVIIGFSIRILPFFNILLSGEISFLQSDHYYYLRRIFNILENFPKIPVYDYYLNYPQKIDLPSPPFYPLFLAMLSYLFTFGKITNSNIEIITSIITSFFGGMVAIPVFLLAKKIFHNKLSLICSLLSVIMVPHYWYTNALAGDHHSLETFLGLLSLNFFMDSYLKKDNKRNIYYLSISLLGLFLVWQGAILYILLFIFMVSLFKHYNHKIPSYLPFSLILTTILYSIFVLLLPPVNSGISYGLYSFSSLVFIIFFLNLLLTLYFYERYIKSYFYIFLILNIFTASLIGKSIIGGIEFISGSEKWFTMSMEMESMYSYFKRPNYKIFTKLIDNLLFASQILLSVCGAFKMLMDFFKNKKDIIYLIISALIFFFFILALLRVRFNYIFTPVMVISAVYLLKDRDYLKNLFLSLSISYLFLHIYLLLNSYTKEETEALKWLRLKTPIPEIKKGDVPVYSVHTLWDDSYRLVYFANRPSIVNGSLILAGKEAFLDHLIIMATDSLEEFLSLINKYKIRYIYYESHTKYIGSMYFDLLGRNHIPPIQRVYNVIGFKNGFFKDNFLENFRLVYNNFDLEKNKVTRIFEYVKGAKIKIKTKSGKEIALSIPVIYDNGSFNFVLNKKADSRGELYFIVPYSTNFLGQVKTEICQISDGKRTTKINITNEDVVEGREIALTF